MIVSFLNRRSLICVLCFEAVYTVKFPIGERVYAVKLQESRDPSRESREFLNVDFLDHRTTKSLCCLPFVHDKGSGNQREEIE